MSESIRFHNPRDWHGANFETLSRYVQGMKDSVHFFPALEEIVEALKADDCPMNLDEKCRIMDLIAAKAKLREVENPNSLIAAIYGWRGKENPIPKWCEAQKEIIKSIHYQASPCTHQKSLSFVDYIQYKNPGELLKELHRHIDGKKGASAAAPLLHAIDAKYLSKRPAKEAICAEFEFDDREFESIRKYLNPNNGSNAANQIKFSFEQ